MTEDEILAYIDKHGYFSFTKDDLNLTRKSLDNLRIFGLTEPHSRYSVKFTQDGLKAFNIGYKNWVNQNTTRTNTMAQELHEQILFYLYQFKTDRDYHDILDEFAMHTDKVLSNTLDELESKGLVKNEIYLTVLGQNRKRRLKSRITISGIELVNNVIKKNNESISQTFNIHGNVGTLQNLNAPNSISNSQSSDSSSKSEQNIADSKINGLAIQSLESNFNDSFNNLNKPIKNKTTEKNNSISTNIIYPVVAGLIVLVIALVIKYFWGLSA
jgi:hypothetical protein